MNEWINQVAVWTVIVAMVVGVALYFVFPPQQQDTKILQSWEMSHDAILVVIEAKTKDDAIKAFYNAYPNYGIVAIAEGKKGWYIKGVRKNAGN